jgi:membrane protein
MAGAVENGGDAPGSWKDAPDLRMKGELLAVPRRASIGDLLLYGALGLFAVALRSESGRPRSARPPEGAAEFENDVRAVSSLAAQPEGKLRASSPTAIPWSGWKDILSRTYQEINDNRLMAVAAGAVFYSLLALFPAIGAFVALYGLFSDPSAIDAQVSTLSGVLPGGALDLLHEELARLTAHRGANGLGFLIGLVIALWSASSGVKAVIDALNVAYGETEKRSFVRLTLVSLAYAVLAMVAAIMMVGAVVVIPIVLNRIGFGSILALLRWPALLALVIVGLAVIYRYLPCRREPRWQWLSVGSVFAGVAWLVSSLLFSWYIGNFGTYNATYGSLGAAVGMMMWMWISMIVILVGAQLNAEIERQAATESAVKPK